MGWTEGREGVRRKVVGRDVGKVVVVRIQTASVHAVQRCNVGEI